MALEEAPNHRELLKGQPSWSGRKSKTSLIGMNGSRGIGDAFPVLLVQGNKSKACDVSEIV